MSVCLVAALHGPAADAIQGLWSQLDEGWGIRRSHPLARPHLTLAIVHGEPPPERLRALLEQPLAGWPSFPVTSAGYGVFVGHGLDSPVLHLAVTRTPRLSQLQAAIVAQLTAVGLEIDGLFAPEHWRPHVTLGDLALTPAMVGAAIRHLVEGRRGHWTLEIDNVSMLGPAAGFAFELALRAGAGTPPR